ncbi:hypothetical protein [Actinomadura sp. BRA 177]|uniref:hypothetical protein n=1 Tax=Actinomadura sp. BRA 177 TaxID=2745202 RepID=UPI001595453B|nr:hypothetical protein [Actinomadura sp. BRA 177]NVI85925.1 hypothetical protein [Actinomadura sp. BRA 177]
MPIPAPQRSNRHKQSHITVVHTSGAELQNDAVLDALDIAVPDGQITALLMAAAALNGLLSESARSTGHVLINGAPVRDQR